MIHVWVHALTRHTNYDANFLVCYVNVSVFDAIPITWIFNTTSKNDTNDVQLMIWNNLSRCT